MPIEQTASERIAPLLASLARQSADFEIDVTAWRELGSPPFPESGDLRLMMLSALARFQVLDLDARRAMRGELTEEEAKASIEIMVALAERLRIWSGRLRDACAASALGGA